MDATGPAALVEAGFDHDAVGGTFDRSLELEHFGLKQHVFKKFVNTCARLGGHGAERHVAAPLFRHDVVGNELLLYALRIGLGLVDLVDGDNERNASARECAMASFVWGITPSSAATTRMTTSVA